MKLVLIIIIILVFIKIAMQFNQYRKGLEIKNHDGNIIGYNKGKFFGITINPNSKTGNV